MGRGDTKEAECTGGLGLWRAHRLLSHVPSIYGPGVQQGHAGAKAGGWGAEPPATEAQSGPLHGLSLPPSHSIPVTTGRGLLVSTVPGGVFRAIPLERTGGDLCSTGDPMTGWSEGRSPRVCTVVACKRRESPEGDSFVVSAYASGRKGAEEAERRGGGGGAEPSARDKQPPLHPLSPPPPAAPLLLGPERQSVFSQEDVAALPLGPSPPGGCPCPLSGRLLRTCHMLIPLHDAGLVGCQGRSQAALGTLWFQIQQRRRPMAEAAPCPVRGPYCVDENTERRNHYLDLAGIENYTSKFGPGSLAAQPKQEHPSKGSHPQTRSRSQESDTHTGHHRRSQVLAEPAESAARALDTPPQLKVPEKQFLKSPKGMGKPPVGLGGSRPGKAFSYHLAAPPQGPQDGHHLPLQPPQPPPQPYGHKRSRQKGREGYSPLKATYTLPSAVEHEVVRDLHGGGDLMGTREAVPPSSEPLS
ncbi:protein naked cuticle homolog 2 [Trichechus manatus latirostris]|uniref:Protein naked cuticle homolog n=1 Tax=Trichechus manatus latirostris TaxID=127582 RepID=A0A2Y9FY31_TRIMA|nr:protein naked cuticle homolog 2 [Trichechus manatus latirostris]